MRLPFLQVDSEAFERAVELAALLEVSEAQALGHLCHLWRWCLSRPQDEALTGEVGGPSPVALLEAGARWQGRRGALTESLLAIGLLEAVDDAGNYRVRGLGRYRDALVRQTSDRDRKRRSRTSGGRPADGVRNPASDADADADAERLLRSRSAPPPKTEDVRPAGLARIEAPDTAPESWSAEDFWRWVQSGRLVQEKAPHPRALSRWWAEARAVAPVVGLKRAFDDFAADPYWRKAKPVAPFGAFMSQWAKYVTVAAPDRVVDECVSCGGPAANGWPEVQMPMCGACQADAVDWCSERQLTPWEGGAQQWLEAMHGQEPEVAHG